MPEELVLVRMHLHGRAGVELGERRGGGVNLIAEDPQVAGAQPTVFAALEFEDGDGLRGVFYRSMDAHMNRLAKETSPYLQQHASNPVHWHPWGKEAFEEARTSGKPVLLSIGYSACHWCHVMAHESFEDPATAALMNELYVNIKVDREERPDIDKIYQFAHQVLTQRGGGWPLTMFLTHDDQKPFFGGTYFPDEARYGMPAFATLLKRVAEYYREQRDELRAQNDSGTWTVKTSQSRSTATPTSSTLGSPPPSGPSPL
jgi:uncharacterized protein YyaL (SSP411 family)